MLDYEVLKLVWWVLIGFLLISFTITDGYNLGVAGLIPLLGKTDTERRVMINAVAPHWDGHQVWLITAGGAIFAAWPMVYATAFSGFYWAMLLVLFALMGRPLAFEFRSKISQQYKHYCDWVLFFSYLIPALVFGVAFGNLFQGFGFSFDTSLRSSFTQGFWSLLNPFALLCGLVSLSMIMMHGAAWLKIRTESSIADRASICIRTCGIVTIIAFTIAGLWLYELPGYQIIMLEDPNTVINPLMKIVAHGPKGSWLTNYQHYPLMLLAPICAYSGTLLATILANSRFAGLAFLASALGIAGIIGTAGVSLFPFIMPSNTDLNSSLTIWDATSSHLTLTIMCVVAGIFVPTIIGYTTWCMVNMWGKVTSKFIHKNSHSLY